MTDKDTIDELTDENLIEVKMVDMNKLLDDIEKIRKQVSFLFWITLIGIIFSILF